MIFLLCINQNILFYIFIIYFIIPKLLKNIWFINGTWQNLLKATSLSKI